MFIIIPRLGLYRQLDQTRIGPNGSKAYIITIKPKKSALRSNKFYTYYYLAQGNIVVITNMFIHVPYCHFFNLDRINNLPIVSARM